MYSRIYFHGPVSKTEIRTAVVLKSLKCVFKNTMSKHYVLTEFQEYQQIPSEFGVRQLISCSYKPAKLTFIYSIGLYKL
jgi:hypothetical protein